MAAKRDEPRDLAGLRARVELLESVVAEAYQFAGAVGAPVRVLDNLDAAVAGRPLPYDTFLPVRAEECHEVANLLHVLEGTPAQIVPSSKKMPRRNTLAAVLGRAGGQKRSRVKAAAARANGAKGGRPPKRAKVS